MHLYLYMQAPYLNPLKSFLKLFYKWVYTGISKILEIVLEKYAGFIQMLIIEANKIRYFFQFVFVPYLKKWRREIE